MNDDLHMLAITGAVGDLDAARWHLVGCVLDARDRGYSWQAIATALGTTRQAAQQRFGDYEWDAEASTACERAMRQAPRLSRGR
jgi:hypothetical protein